MPKKPSDQTTAIRAGSGPRRLVHTVSPPVIRASTVIMPDAASLYDPSQVSYGRAGLEPHGALQEALAALEGGIGARLFPNGLAAMTGSLLALLKAGDDILVVDTVYAPTRRFCDRVLTRLGIAARYYDPALDAEGVLGLAGPATRLIVLESPGSLTFEIQDVPAIAAAARAKGILTIIDNTWGAGLLFKPLDHGVDISVQALTKYVGGHSDCFMGSAAVKDPALLRALDEAILHFGWSSSPDDAYQMLRGLRTLPTRLARHGENALAVARWLAEQPEVSEVICPGLPGSRGHDLWKRDFHGQNGLVTIILESAPQKAVHALLDALKLFGLGFSWGGYESLVVHCDPQLSSRTVEQTWSGPLVRFHVGLENADDLIADLRTGLDAFRRAA